MGGNPLYKEDNKETILEVYRFELMWFQHFQKSWLEEKKYAKTLFTSISSSTSPNMTRTWNMALRWHFCAAWRCIKTQSSFKCDKNVEMSRTGAIKGFCLLKRPKKVLMHLRCESRKGVISTVNEKQRRKREIKSLGGK